MASVMMNEFVREIHLNKPVTIVKNLDWIIQSLLLLTTYINK